MTFLNTVPAVLATGAPAVEAGDDAEPRDAVDSPEWLDPHEARTPKARRGARSPRQRRHPRRLNLVGFVVPGITLRLLNRMIGSCNLSGGVLAASCALINGRFVEVGAGGPRYEGFSQAVCQILLTPF